jgi:hypothetical protein
VFVEFTITLTDTIMIDARPVSEIFLRKPAIGLLRTRERSCKRRADAARWRDAPIG